MVRPTVQPPPQGLLAGDVRPASGLYVVATPLGNLADISARAQSVLAGVDIVLAEDTRRAGLLFQKLGLPSGRFMSFFDQNEDGRVPQVIELLGQGKSIALISDAGTPLLSDPGYRLVSACRRAGLPVVPVPGPSAVATALCACGLPPQPFVFFGFLPRSKGDLRRVLGTYAAIPATLVFFERKNRLPATLAMAAELLGPRECCIARELTKEYEEFITGNLADLADSAIGPLSGRELLGELTVIIGPPLGEADQKTVGTRAGQARASEPEALAVVTEEAAAGGKLRQVAQRAESRVPGWSAKELYRLLTTVSRHEPAAEAEEEKITVSGMRSQRRRP